MRDQYRRWRMLRLRRLLLLDLGAIERFIDNRTELLRRDDR